MPHGITDTGAKLPILLVVPSSDQRPARCNPLIIPIYVLNPTKLLKVITRLSKNLTVPFHEEIHKN